MVRRAGPRLTKLCQLHLCDVRQRPRLEYHGDVRRPFDLQLSGHDKPHRHKYHRVDGIDSRSGIVHILQELSLTATCSLPNGMTRPLFQRVTTSSLSKLHGSCYSEHSLHNANRNVLPSNPLTSAPFLLHPQWAPASFGICPH